MTVDSKEAQKWLPAVEKQIRDAFSKLYKYGRTKEDLASICNSLTSYHVQIAEIAKAIGIKGSAETDTDYPFIITRGYLERVYDGQKIDVLQYSPLFSLIRHLMGCDSLEPERLINLTCFYLDFDDWEQDFNKNISKDLILLEYLGFIDKARKRYAESLRFEVLTQTPKPRFSKYCEALYCSHKQESKRKTKTIVKDFFLERVKNQNTPALELTKTVEALSVLKIDYDFFHLIRELVKHPNIDPKHLLTLSKYYVNVNAFAWDLDTNPSRDLILLEFPDLPIAARKTRPAHKILLGELDLKAQLAVLDCPKGCPDWFAVTDYLK